jgi:hypothetical protein
MTRSIAVLLTGGILLSIFATAVAQERSLVGHKLPGITYRDTEGHAIRAAHYEGSVLVVYGGIPW